MNIQGTLLLTNYEDVTSDYLQDCLSKAGITVYRYNTDKDLSQTSFTYSNNLPIMCWQGIKLRPDNIRAVLFRRPKPFTPHISGDPYQVAHLASEWAEVWEGFLSHIPLQRWINHPSMNFMASHKIEQLSRAVKVGLQIPQSLVTNNPSEALGFFHAQLTGVIVKPIASGHIERSAPSEDTFIYTQRLDQAHLKALHHINFCPVLFQERILKYLDVRVTVVDYKMQAVGLKALDSDGEQRLDIRRHNMRDVEYLPIEVPEDIHHNILALMKSYCLRFAAIDFAVKKDGTWIFFEINPNGQWAWLDISGGFRIVDMFIAALRGRT